MKTRLPFMLAAFLVLLSVCWAEEKAAPAAAPAAASADVKAAESTEPTNTFGIVLQLAMDSGIQYFCNLATNDPDGWFVSPIRQRTVVKWELQKIHYKEISVPQFKYEYEAYEELAVGSSPAEGMKKVTRYRVKRAIPNGEVKVLTQTPDGPIVKEQQVPIYGPGGPDRWDYGSMGANAMVVVALRRAGVPLDDPILGKVADNLGKLVERFGVPDTTFDAAWMTAAFAIMPGDRYSNLTARAAAKLVDGQVRSGPGAGLWGPLCINTELLSTELKIANTFTEKQAAAEKSAKDMAARTAELQKAGKAGKKTTTLDAKLQRDVELMKNELRGIQEALLDCSMLGFHMFDSLGFVSVKDPLGIWEITMAGAPYLFYNQVTADLDSTAQALFALRVAAENGRLPKQTRRPVLSLSARMTVVKTSALEPLKTEEAIKQALAAVEKARAADETWTEMNSHQAIKDFLWLRSIPVADNSTFMELPSPKTTLSTIQGVASLRNAKLALDTAASPGKPLETKGCVTLIRDWLDDKIAAENLGGGNNSPFASLFYVSDVNTAPGSPIGRDWVLWSRVLDWLLKAQDIKVGSWGAGRDIMLSSSLRARLKSIPQPKDNLNLQQMYERAHMAPICYNVNHVAAYQAVDARVTSTAYALMFLGDARNQDVQVDPFFAKTQEEEPAAEAAPKK